MKKIIGILALILICLGLLFSSLDLPWLGVTNGNAWANKGGAYTSITTNNASSMVRHMERSGYQIWRNVPLSLSERKIALKQCRTIYQFTYQMNSKAELLGLAKIVDGDVFIACLPLAKPTQRLAKTICAIEDKILHSLDHYWVVCKALGIKEA